MTNPGPQPLVERSRPDDNPLQVGVLVYDGHTTLDFVGPHTAFTAAGMRVHLVSNTLDPVVSDTGLTVGPTVTLDDCPKELDIVFVPGGAVDEVLLDRARLAFLAERAATASYITSVCTGSLVLAAAGLLDGYRAATHWATRGHLARLGVEVSDERVCIDRNRMTGGGVTAGIDFGLTLVARTLGPDVAKFVQLALEYDPRPPFDAGSPEKAGRAAIAAVHRFGGPVDGRMGDAITRILEERVWSSSSGGRSGGRPAG
jgi:cyclohexyl-isocyanide hydratase